jgi:hypothetical protein
VKPALCEGALLGFIEAIRTIPLNDEFWPFPAGAPGQNEGALITIAGLVITLDRPRGSISSVCAPLQREPVTSHQGGLPSLEADHRRPQAQIW